MILAVMVLSCYDNRVRCWAEKVGASKIFVSHYVYVE